jgi:hypothetical protein
LPTPTRAALLLAGLLLSAAGLTACGDDDVQTATEGSEDAAGAADDQPMADPAAGMCLEGATDCMDTPMDPDEAVSSPADGGGAIGSPGAADDEYPSEAARQRAQEQLGRPEGELEADIRIGRRGEEQMMLTEDYQLGRITVELDDDGSGAFVVTQATVELPDGPETFTLDRD